MSKTFHVLTFTFRSLLARSPLHSLKLSIKSALASHTLHFCLHILLRSRLYSFSKKYLVTLASQADKPDRQYPFIKESNRGETYAKHAKMTLVLDLEDKMTYENT